MADKFLGCDIKLLKPLKGEIIGKKIVVSTCYFLNDSFDFSDKEKVLGYLTSLIDNLEVFQYKINAFCNPANTWIYRVYIDAIVFEIPSIIEKISDFTEQNKANEKLSKIHTNLEYNKNLLMFISNFMSAYIKHMKSNKKYDKIEIYTYKNDKILSHLRSNPEIVVGGHLQTFGTLLRFHPITEDNVDICIMRNCSMLLTPIDLVIQDYWINNTELPYMEYNDSSYGFMKYDRGAYYTPSEEIMDFFFPGFNKTIYLKRSFAGLISCRITPEIKSLFQGKLQKLRDHYVMRNNLTIPKKYEYGIDEGVIPLIFEELGQQKNDNIYTVNLTLNSEQRKENYVDMNYTKIIQSPHFMWTRLFYEKTCKDKKIEQEEIGSRLYETFYNNMKIERSEYRKIPTNYSHLWNIWSSTILSEWCLELKPKKNQSGNIIFECITPIGKYLSIKYLSDIPILLKSIDWKKKPIIDFSDFSQPEPWSRRKYKSYSVELLYDITARDFSLLSDYLFLNIIDVEAEKQVEKLLDIIATQFTQDNFRPFLIIPENIIINGVANPPEVEIIKGKLIDYANRQPPIQAGGAKSKYRRKLSRKNKLVKTKKTVKTIKTKSRK